MSEKVVCPACWSWSSAGGRTTCRQCGTPLLYEDGRPVAGIPAGSAAPLEAGPTAHAAPPAGGVPVPGAPDGASALVAPMGAEPPVPARPRRTARRPLVVVVAGALAVGVPVCAGLYYGLHRGGAGPSPRDVVLTAARLAGTQSVRMDMRADETFTVSGANLPQMSALSGQTMTVQMQMDMQDQRHGNLTFTGGIMGQAVTLSGVVYDGDVYLSTDGGASYRSVPLTSSVSSQYTADSALQYLNDVSTVTDTGPSSVDGLHVERYHADLDGSKLSGVLRTALGTLKSDMMQRVLGSMRYTGGSLDATIDDAGRIRTETGFFDLTMDMGALDPRLSGATITVHGTFDGRFSNYGQPVTVTRPTNVSGASTLP